MLSPDSTWRMDFFRLLADLSDELLPDQYQSTLGAGQGPDTDASWGSFDLPLNPISGPELKAPIDTIVSHASERGLLGRVTVEDLFELLLGRAWGKNELWAEGATVERALSVILKSPEFSKSLPWIAKSLFDRGRWNYFIHIPKTAGSHFQAMVWSHFGPGSLLRAFADEDRGVSHPWVTAAWLQCLMDEDNPQVWVSGHLGLKLLRPTHSMWPSDRIFTIVRDPIDQVASAVNYSYRLRNEQPEEARRYFSAMLKGEVPEDLNALDLDAALIGVAQRDLRLRPSYFFEGDVVDAAIRQHVVVGFQDNLHALLELAAEDQTLLLPDAVVEGKVRVNRSPSAIDVANLSPQVVVEVARHSQAAIAEYFTLRRIAGDAPFVNHERGAR